MIKNMAASAGNMRDMGLIPRLGRSPGGGLQCTGSKELDTTEVP